MGGTALVSIDPRSVRAVGGAVLAFKAAPKHIQKIVTADTKDAFLSQWQRAVRSEVASPPHGRERARLLRNAGSVTIKGSNPLQLAAYQSGSLGKGKGKVSARSGYGPFEFGDGYKTFVRYRTKSRKGRPYLVNRRTQEQLPPRQSNGYGVYDQAAEFAPRIISRWVQSIIWAYYEELNNVRGVTDG
jgi:hypothetical protein